MGPEIGRSETGVWPGWRGFGWGRKAAMPRALVDKGEMDIRGEQGEAMARGYGLRRSAQG